MQQIPAIPCKMPENLYFIANKDATVRTRIAAMFKMIAKEETLPAIFSENVNIRVNVP